jgi:ribosomal protein S18 acetylase RimI-like enzyme
MIDLGRLVELDEVTRRDEGRIDFIRRAIEQGNCVVCTENETILGYGVLEYSFFGMGFVALLYVSSQLCRQGVGSQLMRAMENRCKTPKLFTSTNLSNLPMQSLLRGLAYQESGIIFNLDPGDPELVYCKALRKDAA